MDAKEIREAREARGLSQEAFARLMNVSGATVWRWEHGQEPNKFIRPKLERFVRQALKEAA